VSSFLYCLLVSSLRRVFIKESNVTSCLQNTTGCTKSLCAPDDCNCHEIDDLKMAITEYIRNVDRAILNTVFENTVRRVNKSLETGGGSL